MYESSKLLVILKKCFIIKKKEIPERVSYKINKNWNNFKNPIFVDLFFCINENV